jgi:hypothetical protein
MPKETTMTTTDDERDPLADGTALERSDDVPATPAAKDLSRRDDDPRTDEASGGEKTAVEGLSGIAATHRAFGGGSIGRAGGIGTHVPTDGDDHGSLGPVEGSAGDATTDPRAR